MPVCWFLSTKVLDHKARTGKLYCAAAKTYHIAVVDSEEKIKEKLYKEHGNKFDKILNEYSIKDYQPDRSNHGKLFITDKGVAFINLTAPMYTSSVFIPYSTIGIKCVNDITLHIGTLQEHFDFERQKNVKAMQTALTLDAYNFGSGYLLEKCYNNIYRAAYKYISKNSKK